MLSALLCLVWRRRKMYTEHFRAVRGSGALQHSVSLHAVVCTLLTSYLCFQTSHIQADQEPCAVQLCWQSMSNLPSPALGPLPEENNTVCCCQHTAFPQHSYFMLLTSAASCGIRSRSLQAQLSCEAVQNRAPRSQGPTSTH